MSPSRRGPPSVRTVAIALGVIAVLTLVSGLFTSVLIALASLMDPTLAGDVMMPLTLGLVGLVGSLTASVIPVAAAASLVDGRPAGRSLVGLVGAGLCLTPLLPVGAWMLYVVLGDEEVIRWIREESEARSATA